MSKMGDLYLDMEEHHYSGQCMPKCQICIDEKYYYNDSYPEENTNVAISL